MYTVLQCLWLDIVETVFVNIEGFQVLCELLFDDFQGGGHVAKEEN